VFLRVFTIIQDHVLKVLLVFLNLLQFLIDQITQIYKPIALPFQHIQT